MAKKVAKATLPLGLLQTIAASVNGISFVTQSEAMPYLEHTPPLIMVNTSMTDPNDSTKAAAKLSQAGQDYLSQNTKSEVVMSASKYEIVSNVVLPPSKRGNAKGGGAPAQYPFDQLEVGQGFFVPVSDKHPNPVKTLGSTVSSANLRYAVKTGEYKPGRAAKRGEDGKVIVGADGKKIMEDAQVPVYKHERKFAIRAVEAGKTYGTYVAPGDGAFIARVSLD